MDQGQIRAERDIRWVYRWLIISAFIAVPWMAINLFRVSFRAPTSTYVAAVLWPALVHVVVLPWGLRSPYLYVRRHTQQALLLVTLRVATTVFILGLSQGDAAFAWFIVNGFLWLWGSIWGGRQVKRGDCWLMWRRGESDKLPRPWAEGAEDPLREVVETSAPLKEIHLTPSPMDMERVAYWQRRWLPIHEPTTEVTQLLEDILTDDESLFFFRQRGVISDRTSCHMAVTDRRLILMRSRPLIVLDNIPLTSLDDITIDLAGGAARRVRLHFPHREIMLIATNQKTASYLESFLQELQANLKEATPTTPQASLSLGQILLDQGRRGEAVLHFLTAFRQGTADLRQQAVIELEKLDEVELF